MSLIQLLDEWVIRFEQGFLDDAFRERIQACVVVENDPHVFQQIAENMWDAYSCIDVEIMIEILRRWLALEPNSHSAKHHLGSYLLCHGPDWDDEAKSLLEEDDGD